MDHWSISPPELERYLRRAHQERAQMFAKLSRHAAVGLAQLVREAVTIAGDIGRSAWRRIVRWHLRRAAVRDLMWLDDRLLRDIGLRRSDIHSVVYGILNAAPPSLSDDGDFVNKVATTAGATGVAANDNRSKTAA